MSKAISLSREPAVLAYHLGELISASPGKMRKQLGEGTHQLGNPALLFTEVTLETSTSGIPPQGASGSSKPVEGLVVLAYQHREL
jgi:hypothetical protein